MTVTLSLPPETERALKANATRRGVSLEHYALELLERDNPPADEVKVCTPPITVNNTPLPTKEQRLQAWIALTSHPRPLPYEADDSRESIYAEDGE
ncbi:MAG: CopG family transcriptional regulator [Gemmatales bacterium]